MVPRVVDRCGDDIAEHAVGEPPLTSRSGGGGGGGGTTDVDRLAAMPFFAIHVS